LYQKNNDFDIVLTTVSIRLNNDYDIVLTIVLNNGDAIQYASIKLNNDYDIVLAAVLNDPNFELMEKRFRNIF
jgi:plasmid maintenance system killer protein